MSFEFVATGISAATVIVFSLYSRVHGLGGITGAWRRWRRVIDIIVGHFVLSIVLLLLLLLLLLLQLLLLLLLLPLLLYFCTSTYYYTILSLLYYCACYCIRIYIKINSHTRVGALRFRRARNRVGRGKNK